VVRKVLMIVVVFLRECMCVLIESICVLLCLCVSWVVLMFYVRVVRDGWVYLCFYFCGAV